MDVRRSPRLILAAAGGCAGAFVALMLLAYYVGPVKWVDGAALDGFASVHKPRLEQFASHLAHLCNPNWFALGALTLIAIGAVTYGLRHAAAATVLLAGANLSSQGLKPLLAHFRDLNQFPHAHQLPSASFPSGHSTAAMSLALAAVLVAPRAYRPLVAVLGGVFALGVSFSVLLLSRHFPSDIAGGFLMSTAWGFLVLAGMRAAAVRWPERGTMRWAAHRAIGAPSLRTLAIGAGAVVVAAVVAAATRADAVAGFAHRHTTAVAVASVLAVAAGALLAGVTALSDRPR